jgi:hypothetical protein
LAIKGLNRNASYWLVFGWCLVSTFVEEKVLISKYTSDASGKRGEEYFRLPRATPEKTLSSG